MDCIRPDPTRTRPDPDPMSVRVGFGSRRVRVEADPPRTRPVVIPTQVKAKKGADFLEMVFWKLHGYESWLKKSEWPWAFHLYLGRFLRTRWPFEDLLGPTGSETAMGPTRLKGEEWWSQVPCHGYWQWAAQSLTFKFDGPALVFSLGRVQGTKAGLMGSNEMGHS
ncbi:hypothetical protein Droror1_Dr00017473 [Drosera rotundifolia]